MNIKPILLSVSLEKTGTIFLVNIGPYDYQSVSIKYGIKWAKTKWVALRCKKRSVANYEGHKCNFKMKIKNISDVTEQQNPEVYWRKESWNIVMVVGKIKGGSSFIMPK